MGRKPNSTSIQVMPGLLLKRSERSPFWQCYCRLAGASHRQSTGVEDEAQARLKAMEWFLGMRQQSAAGISLKRVSFEMLGESHLKTVLNQNTHSFHKDNIRRHFMPFFGTISDVKQINAGMVSDYIVHRRKKNDAEPTPQTLNRENTVLRQLLNHAHMQKWLSEPIKVPHFDISQTAKRRLHFTIEEYQLLLATARQRIAEAESDGQKTHVVANRHLLYDAIVLLCNSGMRVDEMHSVTWRGVLWEAGDIQLERAGKRKSSRRMVLRKSAINSLNRIAKRRLQQLKQDGLPEILPPNERVISLPTGERIKDMKTAFRGLIKACAFQYAEGQDRHTLTSLRHSYATFSLTRKFGKRPSNAVLAKQMGTSEKMINLHYGHDTVDDYRPELRGEI